MKKKDKESKFGNPETHDIYESDIAYYLFAILLILLLAG